MPGAGAGSETAGGDRAEAAASDDDAAELSIANLYNPLRTYRTLRKAWAEIDREAAEERAARRRAGLGFDRRPLVAFCGGAVLLTLMEYFGAPQHLQMLVHWLAELETTGALDSSYFRDLPSSPWWTLANHGYWALWRFLGFGLLAIPFVWLGGERVRDQLVSARGFWRHLPIYLVAFILVFGCVIAVSFTEGFQTYYPFYRGSNRSWADLLIWEVLYALQFLGLEFFFRGWWLKACKAQLGSAAIFAMIVPYVMIHFGKEFPETLGAILAGVFLGTLALRTRSIWGGFAVHVFVAVSMDVAALMQTVGLPTTFWPS